MLTGTAGAGACKAAPSFSTAAALYAGAKMAVAHRHLERLVAEELLDGPEVHARHDEVARERVAEIVPAEVADLRRRARALEGGVERRVAHGIAPGPGEDGHAVAREPGEGGARGGVQRDVLRRVVLRLRDRRELERGVDILPPQAQELALAKPRVCSEEYCRHEPRRDVALGSRDETRELRAGEVAQTLVVDGEGLHVGGRVHVKQFPDNRFLEHRLEERELAIHGRRCDGILPARFPLLDAEARERGEWGAPELALELPECVTRSRVVAVVRFRDLTVLADERAERDRLPRFGEPELAARNVAEGGPSAPPSPSSP